MTYLAELIIRGLRRSLAHSSPPKNVVPDTLYKSDVPRVSYDQDEVPAIVLDKSSVALL